MSSPRKITIPTGLVEKLEEFYKIVLEYKKIHNEDHVYEKFLDDPFKELRHNPSSDYAEEVADRFVSMRMEAKTDTENVANRRMSANVLNIIIKDLKQDVELFQKAPPLAEAESQKIQTACKSILNDLSELTEQVMLIKIDYLIEKLKTFRNIVHGYKTQHQDGYESYLETNLNENSAKDKIDYEKDVEEKYSAFENTFIEYLQSVSDDKNDQNKEKIYQNIYSVSLPTIEGLKQDIVLFQRAPAVDKKELKLCDTLLKELTTLSEYVISFKK